MFRARASTAEASGWTSSQGNGRFAGAVDERSTGGEVVGGRRVPIKIAVVDVEACPAEISAEYPGGGRYAAVWVLARVEGEPRALLKLPFASDRMTNAELARHFSGPAFDARPPQHAELVDPPLITVIVPTTFRREQELRSCLESLVVLAYPRFEVLIVNNGVDDVPPAWMGEYPDVRVLRERRPGNAAARNCGLAAARGEIVAFTDDDVVVDPGWLLAFARRFAAHPEEVAVGGLMLPAALETEAQLMYEEFYGDFLPRMMQPVTHHLTRPAGRTVFRQATIVEVSDAGEVVNTFSLYAPAQMGPGQSRAFRTDVLRAVGGFDARLGVLCGEDVLLWARLAWRGFSIGFAPAALVFHLHRRSEQELRHQVRAYGLGFTATLLALVLEDARHLAAILATAPRAASVLSRLFWTRLRSRRGTPGESHGGTITIPELARLEMLGMLRGPAAYARAVLSSRRSAR